MSKLVVRIPDDRRAALREHAAEIGVTTAALIRIAIFKLLDDRGDVTLPRRDRAAA